MTEKLLGFRGHVFRCIVDLDKGKMKKTGTLRKQTKDSYEVINC